MAYRRLTRWQEHVLFTLYLDVPEESDESCYAGLLTLFNLIYQFGQLHGRQDAGHGKDEQRESDERTPDQAADLGL